MSVHDNASVTPISISKIVKRRRLELGLTVVEVAQMCDVGPRFIFDLESAKPTVQLSLVLHVLGQLGVGLYSGVTSTIEPSKHSFSEGLRIVQAPPFDPGHWQSVSMAGALTVSGIGVSWEEAQLLSSGAVELRTPNTVVYPFAQGSGASTAGGYESLLKFVDRNSDAPILDKRTIVRLAVVTTLLADTSFRFSDLCFVKGPGGGLRFQGLPCISTASALFDGRSEGGLKIAGEWPSEWLRADHFSTFAKLVGVKPKVVFDLLSRLSEELPAKLSHNLCSLNKSTVLRGKSADALRLVQGRALRMRDVVALAISSGDYTAKAPRKIFLEKKAPKEEVYVGHETLYE